MDVMREVSIATTKVKTSELAGAALDWAVAKSEGHQPLLMPIGRVEYAIGVTVVDASGKVSGFACRYSSDWAQGGPLIDKYRPGFSSYRSYVHAVIDRGVGEGAGETHLIAACRAIVAAKLGDTVEIPTELLEVVQ